MKRKHHHQENFPPWFLGMVQIRPTIHALKRHATLHLQITMFSRAGVFPFQNGARHARYNNGVQQSKPVSTTGHLWNGFCGQSSGRGGQTLLKPTKGSVQLCQRLVEDCCWPRELQSSPLAHKWQTIIAHLIISPCYL